ncbi:hypothetical protein FJZ31_41220 [Candidatus Poribacteria bacterium]|nr:hypothetical protein [Candidatus Poribacteria bacterium]
MKYKIIIGISIVSIIGSGIWCYYPHQDTDKIAYKMKVPFPGLYSRCISSLARIGTPEAVNILLGEFHSGIPAHRAAAARALSKIGWQPSNDRERAIYLVAYGKYQDAAVFGSVVIKPLIEEFGQVKEASVRSQLSVILQKEIGAIVQKITEIQVSADIEEGSSGLPRIVITGHLLEGEKPDDSSPYVRGDYTTKERLEAKVKYRIYDIYRCIFQVIPMGGFHSVVVRCNHGVRVQEAPFAIPGFGSDRVMTIFETSLSLAGAQRLDWQYATLSDV